MASELAPKFWRKMDLFVKGSKLASKLPFLRAVTENALAWNSYQRLFTWENEEKWRAISTHSGQGEKRGSGSFSQELSSTLVLA